jgi:glycosyltransferase involved in cell wall biosynthesis
MEDNYLISIVLPVYNGQKYLAQSITSVLNQTYKNIELIIVNDCSIDETLNIATYFARDDNRVKIINNNKNKKLPASLNIGHKYAKGKFITWTSDDNFYEKNALKVLLGELIITNGDIIYSNFHLIDQYDNLVRSVDLPGIENIIFGNTISCCFLYKKEVYERNNGYNESSFLVEDYDFWLRAILHSRFIQIKNVLYNYRKHENSLTNQIAISDQKKSSWIENVNIMYLNFWQIFLKSNYIEMAELSTKSLTHQPIDLKWLISNNEIIIESKVIIKQNQNFKKGELLEKVFLKKTIDAMILIESDSFSFSKIFFVIKNYAAYLDINTIKRIIKFFMLK